MEYFFLVDKRTWSIRLIVWLQILLKINTASLQKLLELLTQSLSLSRKDHFTVTDELQSFEDEGEPESREVTHPWQTSVHHRTLEEDRPRIEEEIHALKQVSKPKDVKPISSKWVYKVKTHADGSVERYKARLVARGFSQQYRLDYDETFSPRAKITTVYVLLALAMSKSWKLWQIDDVKNAFLDGVLDRKVYMEQPKRFESKAQLDNVCKLRRAL